MTVKELIEELSQYPDDMVVFCDDGHCEETNPVGGVVIENYSWRPDRGDFLYIKGDWRLNG